MASKSKKFTLLGVEHRSGTYEGRAYDTYSLYCSQEIKGVSKIEGQGVRVATFKLRTEDFEEVTEDSGLPISQPDDLFELIGTEFKIYANQYFIVEELRA